MAINIKKKKKPNKKKPLMAINGSCDKYDTGKPSFYTYESYKIRDSKNRRKKNIYCRKSKDSYNILLRSCPNRLLTKNNLKKKLSHFGLDTSGNRAELCHRLFLYEINNYNVPYNICSNIKDSNFINFNNQHLIYKNPLDNRYHCIPYNKLGTNGNKIPKFVKNIMK